MNNESMVVLDGSLGEGGGQILRSALTLSILTGKPFHLTNIRAKRKDPGLKAQHLTAIDASAAICRAQVYGASLRSQILKYIPGKIKSGRYHFDIKTAGSTSLVLQTIFLPLSFARSSSTVTITGGTHVPWAPSFEYINLIWLPYLVKIGFNATLSLNLAGFYPQGGGRISSTIRPVNKLSHLTLTERGELTRVHGISAVANLDRTIANRQKRQALQRIREYFPESKITTVNLPSNFKGTILLLVAEFQSTQDGYAKCGFYSLGALGKPAEQVANEAVDEFIKFFHSSGVVDKYLTDQLLLPLSFCPDPSELSTSEITAHILTNAHVINTFGVASVCVIGEPGQPGLIRIEPVQVGL